MTLVLAADVGGTKIRAGIVSLGAVPEVTVSRAIPTEAARGGVLERLTGLLEGMLAGAPPVAALGVAAAGVISRETGAVRSATDLLPGWGGTPLRAHLAERFGRPVAVLGDVHAHALGEALAGAAVGARTALVAAVGTGIGGGIVLEGAVLGGDHDVAGHLGHVLHPAAAGLACSCGRSGHIEPLASGPGIVAAYGRAGGRAAGGREVDEAAEAGDPTAAGVVATAGRAFGEVLGSLANVIDPGIAVVSGSVARSGKVWWSALRAGYAAQAMDPLALVPLVPGALGDDAPLIGAALAAVGGGK